jgi:hypothetical protein
MIKDNSFMSQKLLKAIAFSYFIEQIILDANFTGVRLVKTFF